MPDDEVEVGQRQAVAGVAAGDADDKAQVGHHQPPGRLQVVVVAQPAGQTVFLLGGQHRHAVGGADIGLDVPGGVIRSKDQFVAHSINS